MVNSVINYGRNGVHDWIIQRASVVILAFYILFLLGFVIATPDMQYGQWRGLFVQTWMKVFSLAVLVVICAHAWVGMWTISIDYLKAAVVRFVFQMMCAGFLFVYLVWGIAILWSV